MNRIYIITGICGFLGNTVANQLAKAGERVRGLALPQDDASMLPPEVEVIRGNVCDMASMQPLFHDLGTDDEIYVIHTAAIISIDDKPGAILTAVNVGGTRNVIALCREHHVKKLVHVSSVHAIPELPHGEVMSEVESFDPDKVIEPYSKTKAAASQLVLDAARDGLNATVVHPSGIMGPGDYGKGLMLSVVVDYLGGYLPACVKGGYDFVDVRDVANGVIAACDRGRSGECYLLTGGYITAMDILKKLHEMTGRKEIKVAFPLWFIRLFIPVASLVAQMRKAKPLFTRSSLRILDANAIFSHAKATKELGYIPRKIDDTLRDTVQFLVDKRNLIIKKNKLAKAASRA